MSLILKKSMPQSNAEKLKAMFIGLGKPTMRGVRKCINCGTLNGTRGVSCKNKLCGAVFKERGKKKGHSAEAVKIQAGSSILLYSVRLRDRGPDYRGFVQLPIFQDMDGNPATVDSSIVAQNAHCFVESCTLNTGIGGLQEENGCVHIRTAITATEEATHLEMYESVISGLPIPSDMLEALNELMFESSGMSSPLVQRVTRNIMVVKCKVTNKHPFGFLHVAFSETSRNRSETEHKFQCSCKEFKNARDYGLMKEESRRRCVHFYACLCAFASDDSLSKEFSYYLNMEPEPQMIMTDQSVTIDQMVTDADDNLVAFVSDAQVTQDASSMLLASEAIEESKNLELIVDGEVVISDGHNKSQQIIMNDGVFEDGQLVCLQTVVDQDNTALLTVQDNSKYSNMSTPTVIIAPSPISVQQTSTSRSLLTNSPKKSTSTSGAADERGTSLTFGEWLASVTDRINDTMHYQFDGNPDPLVFHVPQKFFDCLQQRISVSSKKKRLPNSATAFVRKDALPLGTFTKYTWNIMNIIHVKQIFDTPMRPLEITRRFVENRDGTFDLCNAPKENTVDSLYGKQPIRPFELKTYLKVGSMTPEEKESPIPFVIEWIPDILPKSQIGELRIKLCYGHQRNGQVEQRFVSHGRTELQTINIQK